MSADLSFDTLLVANRGEIAVRIMRTCRERGIRTVAVYSEADRDALHVRMADCGIAIGASPSNESYLRAERILEAAHTAGAQAIHPGYGFLSESASFARSCADAGIVFVGPPPSAIALMGDKTAARQLMREAKVPMAPGTPEAIEDVREAERIASAIGYPVLVKAAAGGGGKGMRVVENSGHFASAFEMAQSEARNAFGDDRVYIEKYFTQSRHIEIQVIADAFGNIVHLFERECSIQRRHQKVIEEAPSSILTQGMRAEMGTAAIAAARACGYVGAGTVEFLLDEDQRYFFLEMNTRLQVEHPVTEMITGLDLVAEQLRIAKGEPLGFTQEDLSIQGHAIECRVYAEDVPGGFLPDPGPLYRHRPPAGPGIRVDSGVAEGDRVPIYYDPMVSKLISWGPTRETAISRMERALREYEIAGFHTTIPFCLYVMQHSAFQSGNFSTSFIEEHYSADVLNAQEAQTRIAALAALLADPTSSQMTEATLQAARHVVSEWRQRQTA